jgi:hypothetical protein
MLPPFDQYGLLPPGIHRCTVDELVERFGTGSEERVVERGRPKGVEELVL